MPEPGMGASNDHGASAASAAQAAGADRSGEVGASAADAARSTSESLGSGPSTSESLGGSPGAEAAAASRSASPGLSTAETLGASPTTAETLGAPSATSAPPDAVPAQAEVTETTPVPADDETTVEEFMDFVRAQGVERTADEDFTVEQVAETWDDLPAAVRNYEPGTVWGNIVDDRGHHIENQRLPGGYHLSVDVPNGPVNLHYDAHDPLEGIRETLRHRDHEVTPLENGEIRSVFRNDHPDWQPRN